VVDQQDPVEIAPRGFQSTPRRSAQLRGARCCRRPTGAGWARPWRCRSVRWGRGPGGSGNVERIRFQRHPAPCSRPSVRTRPPMPLEPARHGCRERRTRFAAGPGLATAAGPLQTRRAGPAAFKVPRHGNLVAAHRLHCLRQSPEDRRAVPVPAANLPAQIAERTLFNKRENPIPAGRHR